MESVLITGGTGLIGGHLTKLLQQEGYEVMHVSREKSSGAIRTFQWDVEKRQIEEEAITGTDHIIHLAGANVAAHRWTPQYKEEIIDSRVQSTFLLRNALYDIPNRVTSFICASAVGFYGDRGEEWLGEEAEHATDFLGITCAQWEVAVRYVETLKKRVVMLRTGIVLAREEGALPELLKPIQYGIAPIFGSGRQFYPWIHIDDVCRMYLHAIRNTALTGPVNGVTPIPERYSDFISAVAKSVGKKKINIPVPMPILKMIKGEFVETLAYSYRCSSKKVESSGFTFKFPELNTALKDLAGPV